MGIAALVTALVLHSHAMLHRQQVSTHPVWPPQGTITSPFGRDGARWHPGIDIGTLRTLVVRAAVPGRVEKVGEPTGFLGYGDLVLVRSKGPPAAPAGARARICTSRCEGTTRRSAR